MSCPAMVYALLFLGLIGRFVAADTVEFQPLAAQSQRIAKALDDLGAPLNAAEQKSLSEAVGIDQIEKTLDPHCLLIVEITPESRVKVSPGAASPRLVEQGWRTFLVKVINQAGVQSALNVDSPNAGPLASATTRQVPQRWLLVQPCTSVPLNNNLSGLGVEYRVISLFSRDHGMREAALSLDVGQGTQDLGWRSEANILFTVDPAVGVKLEIRDENGKSTTAALVAHDSLGRVYPPQAKRLAPDFAFQPQVYRADGQMLLLPAGRYDFEVSRGPEYLTQHRTISVADKPMTERFDLQRWIDPSLSGWYSGDHHIHAAGCAHYSNPTEGVFPSDMIVHCMGEDLKVGCALTWGPCFDFQKQFFTGGIDKVSKYPYLLRYDIEVSGFGSHQSGHLVLLRLKHQLYPGNDSDLHWPTLGLSTLKWAKAQGAICGTAHSGYGLGVAATDLPNYVVPPYNGIGANEYIVDVTHEVPGENGKLVPAVDFMSMMDTPYVWELNMWYHTLNCGYRPRISGETDFPCISGQCVGLGRSYVKLEGPLDFDQWCEGLRTGRGYVSDGYSHLFDVRVNECACGQGDSELKLDAPGIVHIRAKVAALLQPSVDSSLHNLPLTQKPFWGIERARISNSRQVPVELIVNGYPVARQVIEADGMKREIAFETKIDRSSWVALRILPSSHSNPVFVLVAGKPIRASRRSAQWCLSGVDECWSRKRQFLAAAEMFDATGAYEHARQAYRRILAECEVE